MQELKAKVLLSEQDLDCPHLAEAKGVSQDQVPPRMVATGIFPFISVEAILSPLMVSLRTGLSS